jgi:hypothetical protein
VGTDGQGIFVSKDGGSTWETFNDGLSSMDITRLKMDDASPPHLIAGTMDGGVWITELEEGNSSPVSSLQPSAIKLKLYPNPNQGMFYIGSGSDTGLKGILRITNLLGEVIYIDKNFEIAANSSRSISMDAVSPGCYLLILNNNEQTITRKILVEKR